MATDARYVFVIGSGRSRRSRKIVFISIATAVIFLIITLPIIILYVVPQFTKTDITTKSTGFKRSQGVNRILTCGKIVGSVEVARDSTLVYAFKGIPYAKPPIGKLRWKGTQPLPANGICWSGVREAKKYGSLCSQYTYETGKEVGSEDCLYLNVWTPAFDDLSNLPVFVYIHGGSLLSGSGEIGGFKELVKSGIVGVSMNYRLNAFGFLTLNAFSEASPNGITSNFGFVDQIEALRWVKRNIRVFGGNPNKVTIAGFSAGGKSIVALLASPLANGLFVRAISMSSPVVYRVKQPKAAADNEIFIKRAKCTRRNTNATLGCLYAMNTSEILKAIPWNEYPYWTFKGYRRLPIKGHLAGAIAVIDKKVVPSLPTDLDNVTFKPKSKIPILLGTAAQDWESFRIVNLTKEHLISSINSTLGTFGSHLALDVTRLYRIGRQNVSNLETYFNLGTDSRLTCQTEIYASNVSRSPNHIIYRYVVTSRPSRPVKAYGHCCYKYAYHGWDINALFDFSYHNNTKHPASPKDLAFADSLVTDFLNFIKTGRPAQAKWLPYPKTYVEYGTGNTKIISNSTYHQKECKVLMDSGIYKYGVSLR